MISVLKNNVETFNTNVLENKGYIYTTNAPLSAVLANKRISDAIVELIGADVKTIIDIGCGDGTYTEEIANRKTNISVSGFDPAREAVKIAKQKYPKLSFFEGNILDASTLGDHKFDLAVLRGVLHHLPDPDLAIQNSGSIVDRIVILEPNGNNPILKIIEQVSSYHRKHEEQSFSSKKIEYWCLKNNFEIKYLNYIGFVPMFFPAFFTKVVYLFQPVL